MSNNLKILLIEDDQDICELIEHGFNKLDHKLIACNDGQLGLDKAIESFWDVLIIDRNLPHLNGMEIIAQLKNRGDNTPIIILSAFGEVDHRVEGLKAGAQDYLCKPFAFAELAARVEVLAKTAESTLSTLYCGEIKLDQKSQRVERAGTLIRLQPREYQLLEYFILNKDKVLTRTMLLEAVWDYNFDPQTNLVDVHVSRLRTKINAGFTDKMISTKRGIGYVLNDQ